MSASGPTEPVSPRRLGVAVEIPEPYATELTEVRRGTGDPLADQMPPHITLVPPVVVDAAWEVVHDVLSAGAARIAPFDVHLRGTGSFRPVSEVVFVTVAAGIGALEELAKSVRARPLDPRRRFPYHPHVTIAQDVAGETLDEVFEAWSHFEARFAVESFRLYVFDEAQQRWHVVRDYPLGG